MNMCLNEQGQCSPRNSQQVIPFLHLLPLFSYITSVQLQPGWPATATVLLLLNICMHIQ